MCGRFSLTVPLEKIIEYYKIANGEELAYEISYNIAPSQQVLSIISDHQQNYRAGYLRWGLVPSWAKEPSIGYKMINARAETIDQKRSFKRLLDRKRCIIIADGFYEWKKESGGTKQPYRIILKNRPFFAFAGLWDRWEKEDKILHTCTIITTKANQVMAPIHDRMPVILKEEAQKIWLDRSNHELQQLKSLLLPYPAKEMVAYEVSALVNSPKNNEAECIKPIKG